jgi:hypothetical protein
MLRRLLLCLLLFSATKALGQDTSRLFIYHVGLNLTYVGDKAPDFTFPFGAGISLTSTLNKFSRFKPTIEASIVAFPEFVIHIFGSSNNDNSEYSYEVYNLLVGTKYKLNNLIKIALTTGPTLNSVENKLQAGIKSSIEINSKYDRFLAQLYYLRITNSDLINGYTGISLAFRIR